jgi:hypothetical protein
MHFNLCGHHQVLQLLGVETAVLHLGLISHVWVPHWGWAIVRVIMTVRHKGIFK